MHTLAKEVLSSAGGYEARCRARQSFCASSVAMHKAIVLLERSSCETISEVVEPQTLPCRNVSALIQVDSAGG